MAAKRHVGLRAFLGLVEKVAKNHGLKIMKYTKLATKSRFRSEAYVSFRQYENRGKEHWRACSTWCGLFSHVSRAASNSCQACSTTHSDKREKRAHGIAIAWNNRERFYEVDVQMVQAVSSELSDVTLKIYLIRQPCAIIAIFAAIRFGRLMCWLSILVSSVGRQDIASVLEDYVTQSTMGVKKRRLESGRADCIRWELTDRMLIILYQLF